MAKYEKGISPKDISRERIEILFTLARNYRREFPVLAARYVEHARDISTKQRVRLTQEEKRLFCHRCGSYFVFGKNSRVRIARGRVIISCGECGHIVRIPLSKGPEQ